MPLLCPVHNLFWHPVHLVYYFQMIGRHACLLIYIKKKKIKTIRLKFFPKIINLIIYLAIVRMLRVVKSYTLSRSQKIGGIYIYSEPCKFHELSNQEMNFLL